MPNLNQLNILVKNISGTEFVIEVVLLLLNKLIFEAGASALAWQCLGFSLCFACRFYSTFRAAIKQADIMLI
jgi:hypothetical protein